MGLAGYCVFQSQSRFGSWLKAFCLVSFIPLAAQKTLSNIYGCCCSTISESWILAATFNSVLPTEEYQITETVVWWEKHGNYWDITSVSSPFSVWPDKLLASQVYCFIRSKLAICQNAKSQEMMQTPTSCSTRCAACYTTVHEQRKNESQRHLSNTHWNSISSKTLSLGSTM